MADQEGTTHDCILTLSTLRQNASLAARSLPELKRSPAHHRFCLVWWG